MKHLSKRILSCALALLLCLGLGSVAVTGAGTPEVTVTLSYADVTGFYVTPQKQFTIPADLSEECGFEDDFNGEKVSVMDAIVFLHLLLLGDVDGYLDAAYDSYYDSWWLPNFMGDGIGAYLGFVNGEDPGFGAFAVEIKDGDALEFFAIYDTDWWADFYTWFEVDGERAGAVTVVTGETLELTLESSMFSYPMGPIEDADIVQLDPEDEGTYNTAAFSDALVLATTDGDGIAEISFATAGTYYVSAASDDWDDDPWEPIMAPWLEVTVLTPAEFVEFQADAEAALDTYKNPAAYKPAQQAELAAIIEAAQEDIANATTVAEVNAILAEAKAAMDAVKTAAQLGGGGGSSTLPQAKTDAKAALDSCKNADDYREAQKTELAAAIAAGKTAIDAATTTAAVDTALADAKAAIDAIKTDAQLTAEEAAALAQAKTNAKAALDSCKDADDYRDEQKAELADAIAAGKAAIDAATTEAAVAAALAGAKAAMDAVKTDAQLTEEEQQAKEETPKTLLEKWHAKLPGWMKGVEKLWNGFEYVILFVGFGWIWFLF